MWLKVLLVSSQNPKRMGGIMTQAPGSGGCPSGEPERGRSFGAARAVWGYTVAVNRSAATVTSPS